MRDIGKNIKTIRKTKKMTQEALADALYVTRQTVSNYENGRSRPDLDMLLKITEVLETDINTVIYGPPIPQSKKNSCKWLFISVSVLLVMTVLYVILDILFPRQTVFGYQYSARIAVQLALRPIVMLVFGWVLTHSLSVFFGAQQLGPEKGKVLRIVIWVLLFLITAIPIPIILFSAIAGYRSFVYHRVSMSFPYIPVYQELFYAVMFVIYRLPFVYTVLGAVCWLLGLPRIEKKNGDSQNTETE